MPASQLASDFFEQAYELFFERIFNYVYSRVGNIHDTQDIVAEIFTSCWENCQQQRFALDSPTNIKGWLYAVSSNKLNDYLRRKYKLAANFSSIDVERVEEPQLLSTNSNPTANIMLAKVEKLVNRLTAKDQTYFDLRFRKNYKQTEVAAALGISLNNAKVTQTRLLKKIRKLWTEK